MQSRKPSTDAPVRQHRLLTMTAPKLGKRKFSQQQKEHKQITKCLRQRLAWCNCTGQSYNPAFEQYAVNPLPVVLDVLQDRWTPEAAVIDGLYPTQAYLHIC